MKILLAEDDETVSKAICHYLSRYNCDVEAVYDGEDALMYAQSNHYSCIILDTMMPKMDGLSVLRQLRNAGNVTPIMLVTAKTETECRIEGLNAGADDYLCKPFALGELLARVRAMVRRRNAYVPDIVRFGNIALDQAQFRLCRDCESIQLSATEFRLMKLFMRNPRIVFSCDALLEHIWKEDSQAKKDTVRVYISYLRRKLKTLRADVHILSRRSIGYMLDTKSE